ncbi:MAG: hypothetical protein N2643_03535 [Endomicrobia bacterium]|nr:hypothetical protein [Endomicrobiia bacterium]
MSVLFIKLKGGCMRPLLKTGQIVPIFLNVSPKIGDIILYKTHNSFFLHRVVKIFPKYIVVSDDCGITFYNIVAKDDVIGVYHSMLSGILGYLYHIVVKNSFIFLRFVKNIIIFSEKI